MRQVPEPGPGGRGAGAGAGSGSPLGSCRAAPAPGAAPEPALCSAQTPSAVFIYSRPFHLLIH